MAKEGWQELQFFYVATAKRGKRNRIDCLINDEGTECRGEKEVAGDRVKKGWRLIQLSLLSLRS